VAALDPDLVCVTGDIADSAKTELPAWTPLLAGLRARHGVFAILGNHDRDAGVERVAAAILRDTPWRLLRDAMATLDVGAGRLHVLGLEDRRVPSITDRLPSLLAQVPAGGFAVLLGHHPTSSTRPPRPASRSRSPATRTADSSRCPTSPSSTWHAS